MLSVGQSPIGIGDWSSTPRAARIAVSRGSRYRGTSPQRRGPGALNRPTMSGSRCRPVVRRSRVNGIDLPDSVAVTGSLDGESFADLAVLAPSPSLPQSDPVRWYATQPLDERPTRYLQVHAPGDPGVWIFVDEIIVR
jgi:hypothetical protein